MVAHHCVSALELAQAAGQDVSAIVARTQAALFAAGDRAESLNALPQAERYYAGALELAPADDPARPYLLFRYGRVLYRRDERGDAELGEARDALLAAGDPEHAAEAMLLLADIAWKSGRSEDVALHLEGARSLVAGRPPSRAQVAVLSEVARYDMVGGRLDSAIEVGAEALAMADALGFDDLRAHALNNIGAARAESGDRAGLAQLEESIELAWRLNSISNLLRGHNNLTVCHVLHGDFELARAYETKTIELAEQFGQQGFARFMEAGAVAHRLLAGEWDEALGRADAALAEGGPRSYVTAVMHAFRGLIRAGRGDDLADKDAEASAEFARAIRDPQALVPNLSMDAAIFLLTGKEQRAGQILTEAVGTLRTLDHLGFAASELQWLAWAAVVVGREAELIDIIDGEPFKSPWLRAAGAVVARDFRAAADIFGGIGIVAHEAFFRLRAAEALVAERRRAEADEQLNAALAFYRSVAAARFVREGEALLAASA